MMKKILGYIRGNKHLSRTETKFEIVLTDGTVRHIRPGKVYTDGGIKYTVNSAGGPVKLYDPSFKLKKMERSDMTPAQRKEMKMLNVTAVIVVTITVAGIALLIGLAVTA